ncbi:MAG: primosomal protein N' [Clostridiales bacterium]|nr:primosomal protein N' [Clostridiales bacterium]
MSAQKYARVIVDIASDELDRVFSYRVPGGMTLQPGHRVLAPFGARPIEGYVVSLSDEPGVDERKLKDIVRPLDPYPAILPELMDLALWMREKYLCSLAEALRLMIPAQMRGGRVREKTVAVARLAIEGEALEKAIASCGGARRQAQVLRELSAGPAPLSGLASRDAVKALQMRGLVEVAQEGVRRVPYAATAGRIEPDPALMPQQAEAVALLEGAMAAGGGRFLLHGVTGSGKTEVYIRAIRRALAMGRTAVVLVPEIALTPQMVDWFRARFGDDAALMHSRLSPGERYDEWRRVREGTARVVIGARSAAFAPVRDLGLVVVDEEHESSYQSDRHPRYDAREVAWRRAEREGGVLLLGSATPSIASYMRAMPGVRPDNRLTLIEMPARVRNRPLPSVQVVDMRQELLKGNRSIFSAPLADALRENLAAGHQSLLFINRRGYSTFVSCRACGYVERCEQCDVSMTYHMADGRLRCHYCGAERRPPEVCPSCGSQYIKYFGTGTQKVEQEVRALLPNARVKRMDMDTTSAKDAHEAIVSDFRAGQYDVLVGTQMIAKGLDFPNVTLVGVVAADLSLHVPDYRSVERTFQLITQVAGRAGRADAPGRVVVQTYDPDHYGVKLAAAQDYRAFYLRESQARRRGLYPPFTVVARLLVSSTDERAAHDVAIELEGRLNRALDGPEGWRRDTVQMRAMEAPLKRIRGEARWQVFIKMYARPSADAAIRYMETLRLQAPRGVRVELDVNPASML